MDIKVRVRAGARREKFEVTSPTSFEMSVREKALDNAANQRVVEFVARHFKVSTKAVRIVKGHHVPSKIISVG